jgi:hypothetical protein
VSRGNENAASTTRSRFGHAARASKNGPTDANSQAKSGSAPRVAGPVPVRETDQGTQCGYRRARRRPTTTMGLNHAWSGDRRPVRASRVIARSSRKTSPDAIGGRTGMKAGPCSGDVARTNPCPRTPGGGTGGPLPCRPGAPPVATLMVVAEAPAPGVRAGTDAPGVLRPKREVERNSRHHSAEKPQRLQKMRKTFRRLTAGAEDYTAI